MNDSKHRDAILYSFAIEPHHDNQTLECYIRKYPDLADDLIDLLSELRVTESGEGANVHIVRDPGCEDAWNEFIAAKPKTPRTRTTANPFTSFRGQAWGGLAESARIPQMILAALRDRLVEPSSIPDYLIQRLAQAMESTSETVCRYLAEPPVIIGTAQLKPDNDQSHPARITFEELLEKSELTDQQRKSLRQP